MKYIFSLLLLIPIYLHAGQGQSHSRSDDHETLEHPGENTHLTNHRASSIQYSQLPTNTNYPSPQLTDHHAHHTNQQHPTLPALLLTMKLHHIQQNIIDNQAILCAANERGAYQLQTTKDEKIKPCDGIHYPSAVLKNVYPNKDGSATIEYCLSSLKHEGALKKSTIFFGRTNAIEINSEITMSVEMENAQPQ